MVIWTNLKREKQFCNGAIAIEKEKRGINFNNPIYISTSILNLGKVLMQDFRYNYIKNEYDDKVEVTIITSIVTQKIQNITNMQII